MAANPRRWPHRTGTGFAFGVSPAPSAAATRCLYLEEKLPSGCSFTCATTHHYHTTVLVDYAATCGILEHLTSDKRYYWQGTTFSRCVTTRGEYWLCIQMPCAGIVKLISHKYDTSQETENLLLHLD